MANGFNIKKIELNSKGISNLLSSDAVHEALRDAVESDPNIGEVKKEYLSLDRHPGHMGTRWKIIAESNEGK